MSDRSQFAPVTNLLGAAISDIDGVIAGNVSDFLIDENEGRIAYVQLRLSGCNGAPPSRITVPWSAIASTRGRGATWQLRVAVAALRTLARP